MFRNDSPSSMITTMLPPASANRVIEAITARPGTSLLSWTARGTVLHDHWLKRWFPPVSPARTALSAIVPEAEAAALVDEIVEVGRLHQQATGAVYSVPAEHTFFGADFHRWPGSSQSAPAKAAAGNLGIIHCIVDHRLSDRVARAAIAAGAHGPIVYYCEGRGLRDRLGWLRITKEHEKEVLTVIADPGDVEDVFEAMAVAGQLHLPGRGFMYRLNVDRGLFNLPSRFSHHHYPANMQQIINAIDHLAGHTHWRDQSAADIGGGGRSAGLGIRMRASTLEDQRCLTGIVNRDQLQVLMDLLLDAGAPGLNVNYARFVARDDDGSEEQLYGARINQEYGLLRCVTDVERAAHLARVIEEGAAQAGVSDFCATVTEAPRVATYLPGATDFRSPVVQAA